MGVGIHTVKLARMMGMRVVAVSSSPGKAGRLRSAGAEEALVPDRDGFHKQVKSLTEGGADAVIEIAGSVTFGSSLRCLKPGGRLVLVGNVEPGNVLLNPGLPILRELEIIGSAHATVADLKQVVELVRRGEIGPEIGATVPVAQAAEAHRMMEGRQVTGRVVLTHL